MVNVSAKDSFSPESTSNSLNQKKIYHGKKSESVQVD